MENPPLTLDGKPLKTVFNTPYLSRPPRNLRERIAKAWALYKQPPAQRSPSAYSEPEIRRQAAFRRRKNVYGVNRLYVYVTRLLKRAGVLVTRQIVSNIHASKAKLTRTWNIGIFPAETICTPDCRNGAQSQEEGSAVHNAHKHRLP
jgi:hypothetical protein